MNKSSQQHNHEMMPISQKQYKNNSFLPFLSGFWMFFGFVLIDSDKTDITKFFPASKSMISQILSPNGRDQPSFWQFFSIFRFRIFRILRKNHFFPPFLCKGCTTKIQFIQNTCAHAKYQAKRMELRGVGDQKGLPTSKKNYLGLPPSYQLLVIFDF